MELCRVKDSGLLCINLSNALKGLKEKKLPQNLKELRLPGLGNPAAYPAMGSDVAPSVTIITCGKENSESIDKFDKAPAFAGKMNAAREVVNESGLTGRRTIIVSALRFGDPNHDPSLRSHVGCQPDILKGVFATYESSTAVKGRCSCWPQQAWNQPQLWCTATRIDTNLLHLDGCWQAL